MVTLLMGAAALVALITILHFIGMITEYIHSGRKPTPPESVIGGIGIIFLVGMAIALSYVLGDLILGLL